MASLANVETLVIEDRAVLSAGLPSPCARFRARARARVRAKGTVCGPGR